MSDVVIKQENSTVIDKHKCTLCGACLNVCPVGAISFQEDAEGFNYPVIDSSKCTNCGLCTKKCPALNTTKTKELAKRFKRPVCYGGYIKDEEVRKKSSSGGVFSILADYVLEKNGYVCGAKFFQGGTVEHVIINNKEDLEALRGSKYTQSHVNDCYKKIKELLKQDKYVLFTGTPCQVAALYQVLGCDYDKLITVDLLCHGCPSQKVFKQYLDEATDNKRESVVDVKFRHKNDSWHRFNIKILSEDFEIEKLAISDIYFRGFVSNILIRKSCIDCRFNRLPRQGDFTMGDFWGVENHYKELDDDKGTSALLVNSEKAQKVLKETQKKYKKLKKVKEEIIQRYNMIERKSYSHNYRSYFFDKYAEGNYESIQGLIEETLNKKDGIALLNYHYSKNNYGSVLTAYALQQKVKSLGYTPVNINFWDMEKADDMSNLGDFTKKYIAETAPCGDLRSLRALNNQFSTFIVGPDCVWKDLGFMPNFHNNLFNFVRFSKNICSYAASFGNSDLSAVKNRKSQGVPPEEVKIRKMLYKRFNHISVREKNGVKICNEIFDVPAEHVLDAVFFLNQDEWKKVLPDKSFLSDDCEIVSYVLHHGENSLGYNYLLESDKKMKLLYTGTTYIKNFLDPKNFVAKGVTIEEWLSSIMDCKYFVTDSFHGMCFAILFNKQFITFNNVGKGYDRLSSLMEMLEIPDRTANSKEDVERLLNTPIDYKKVNKKLKEHIKNSEDFLIKVLSENGKFNQVRSYMESLEMRMEIDSNSHDKKHRKLKKLCFLGIPIVKVKTKGKKQKTWVYILGIPVIRVVEKANKTCYKLFGFLDLFKRKYK